MMDLYLKMFISLFFVLLLLFAFYLISRKEIKHNKAQRTFNVLDYKSFGPKSGIMALQVGKKILILTITPTSISMIKEFDEEIFVKKDQNASDLIKKLSILREKINELK